MEKTSAALDKAISDVVEVGKQEGIPAYEVLMAFSISTFVPLLAAVQKQGTGIQGVNAVFSAFLSLVEEAAKAKGIHLELSFSQVEQLPPPPPPMMPNLGMN